MIRVKGREVEILALILPRAVKNESGQAGARLNFITPGSEGGAW